MSTGTTILAFKYKDGVLLASDGRTSSGVYAISQTTDKLVQVSENMIFCTSGSAADTQRIRRIVQNELNKLCLIENKVASVDKAATLVGRIIYQNKDNMLAALIIAGYDSSPKINKVNICGTVESNLEIAIGGSGSAYIIGFCESEYKPDMELKEAIDFAKKAVGLAIMADNASGGAVRIASITKDKTTRYFVPTTLS